MLGVTFKLSKDECFDRPLCSIVWLGFQIHTQRDLPWVSVAPDKVAKYNKQITDILSVGTATIR